MPYHCGMCGQTFDSRGGLSSHTAAHEDNRLPTFNCPVCQWPFDDSHELEQHQIQSGHYIRPFVCKTCSKSLTSMPALEEHHRKTPRCRQGLVVSATVQKSHANDVSAKVITCDRCPNTFTSQREYNAHRSFPNGPCADFKKKTKQSWPTQREYVDVDQPRKTEASMLSYDDSSDTPTNMSDGGEWCHDCKTIFESKAKFNNHALACSARKREKVAMAKASLIVRKSIESIQPVVSQDLKPVLESSRATPLQGITNNNAQQAISLPQPATASGKSFESLQPALSQRTKSGIAASRAPSVQASQTATSDSNTYPCTVNGCGKSFRSEAGLKTHKTDAHGIGGQALDLTGRQSFMLGQSARSQLRAEGLLRGSARPPGGRGRARGDQFPRNLSPSLDPNRLSPPCTLHPTKPNPMDASRTKIVSPGPVRVHEATQGGPNGVMIGSAEMEQGKHIQGKILRLMIQDNIFIRPDGVITACGVDWNRLSVATQQAFVEYFDSMCHLPKALQGDEYLPPPKAFKDDYTAQYSVAEFEASPNRDLTNPGLSVVAIACSKVVLVDSRHEVVKVAAIDVTTCRILMSHLVCTNSKAQVRNWNKTITGVFAWNNMEQARQAGYKVFKGWPAARSALWKFVDKDTILVGHNLRADLDALRIIHGRAVDVAKVVEKVAKGPLSKQQLSLDSLCRDYPKVILKSDPEYGRDCLMNAFAIRQLGCWILKNQDKFSKDAKQKSVDYQKVETLLKANRA